MAPNFWCKFLLLNFVLFKLNGGMDADCPSNCLCTVQEVQCVIQDCERDNIYSGYAPKLEVVGQLCPKLLQQLEDVSAHYSFIQLTDARCPPLPNCR